MANFARFLINASASTDGGFDATAGQTLTFQLEGTPSGVVQRATFEVYDPAQPTSPLASKNAPALSLAGATTGTKIDAATPASAVTTTMPTGVHSYRVRCSVNGGLDPNGSPSADYSFERLVVIRSAGGLRKVVSGESTDYSPSGAADAQNDLIDALVNGVGTGPSLGLTYAVARGVAMP